MEFMKDWIGSQLVGKTVHLTCDCTLGLDMIGKVTGYVVKSNEVIWLVSSKDKFINIGENHPGLKIEVLE